MYTIKKLSILGSLKRVVTRIVDPDRDRRVEHFAGKVYAELARLRNEFRYQAVADELEIDIADRRLVAEAVYVRSVKWAGKDQQLSDIEARRLAAIANRCGLSDSDAKRSNMETATDLFDVVFSEATQDCEIDEGEAATLNAIAGFCGLSIGDIVERWFKTRRTDFLRAAFDRITSDGGIDDAELKSFQTSMQRLGVPEAEIQRVLRTPAAERFERALLNAMHDGHIDDKESRQLSLIAWICGETTPSMMKQFFATDGEAFLRNAFVRLAEDGQINTVEWRSFCETVSKLGFAQSEMRQVIRTPARQFIEHVLADAKSDGDLSESESKTIAWLLENLVDDQPFASYVADEVRVTKQFGDIARGKLPSLPTPPGIELRSGEIVHYVGPVIQYQTRQLASGSRTDTNEGIAAITDTRMLFSSTIKSFQISHRKILGHHSNGDFLEVRCEGKGAGFYQFQDNHSLAIAIWKTAIGRANQTIIDERPEKESRHIPRDIRQRVWQRYAGRCAECNADQYLEFDHIVPVVKEGGNTANNVQLLCRRCNLTKRDNI